MRIDATANIACIRYVSIGAVQAVLSFDAKPSQPRTVRLAAHGVATCLLTWVGQNRACAAALLPAAADVRAPKLMAADLWVKNEKLRR